MRLYEGAWGVVVSGASAPRALFWPVWGASYLWVGACSVGVGVGFAWCCEVLGYVASRDFRALSLVGCCAVGNPCRSDYSGVRMPCLVGSCRWVGADGGLGPGLGSGCAAVCPPRPGAGTVVAVCARAGPFTCGNKIAAYFFHIFFHIFCYIFFTFFGIWLST